MAGPTIDWMKCVRIIASAIPIIDYIPSPRSIMAYTVARRETPNVMYGNIARYLMIMSSPPYEARHRSVLVVHEHLESTSKRSKREK